MSFDFTNYQHKANKAVTHVQSDVATLRTGKATIQLLDPVSVDVYGTEMKVQELANVSVPDPNLLVIKPWDQTILEDLEKAIASAGLNLNPVVDGDLIRIVIPPLTEDRRKEMVKQLYQKVESGRVMMRSIRTDAKKEIENQEGESNISKDDIHRDLTKLNDLTQEQMDVLEELLARKEQELMTV